MEKRRDAMHCVPTFFPPCINHIVVRGTNWCAGDKLLCGAQIVVRGTICCAGHKLLCGAQIVVRGTNCCAHNWRASSLQDVGFALCFFPTFALRLHKL